jgi:hypothetical protein
LLKSTGVVKHARFLIGPAGVECDVDRRQHAAGAVADQRHVVLARVLLHAAQAIGDEVEHVVLDLEVALSSEGALQSIM